jgi:hypothetical protein
MTQSVITDETKGILVAKLERVLERHLTAMEEAMVEYTLTQIRLDLVSINSEEVK